MKKFLTLVFVSVLGGVISLSSYKLFIEKDVITTSQTPQESTHYFPTSLNTKKNNYSIENAPSFADAAEKTIDAVVHVKNTSVVSGPVTFQDLLYGRRSQHAQVGTGSGVIISPDGYIITNNHVIDGAKEISITLNDNRTLPAELVGTDPKTDVALLKIDADDELPFTTFGDSDQVKVGEWVLAVGNPFNLTSTVTAGIISAKSRDLTGQHSQSFLQTDAAVNPGNSGGALVNSNGDLIGINTAISSQTGSYIGYSFAVPSNIARKVVEDIMEFGNVQNGILGVSGISLNSEQSEDLDIDVTEGFYVSNVEDKSGAKNAGIKSGDIIKQIDNVRISKFADLTGYLSTKRPNDLVEVTVLRDGKEKTLPVKLSKSEILTVTFLDMQLKNIPSATKEKYNIKQGVLVTKNDNYWLYQKIGINRGTIITDINDTPINSIDDINTLKQKYGNDFKENIEKISILNSHGQKQSFIFR
ncbi:Do family serine endopeptidase [Corallibacter vietnamensis]|uniref:Do family serine endopeptidase n=1 Tax=Corallibacter vietnamensis TaxID=904130 RepID=A0ABP7HFZ8_9FLAO